MFSGSSSISSGILVHSLLSWYTFSAFDSLFLLSGKIVRLLESQLQNIGINALKFAQSRNDILNISADISASAQFTMADRYFISRSNDIVQQLDNAFAQHQYVEATRVLCDFIWNEFADWHVEVTFCFLLYSNFDILFLVFPR